MQRQTISVNNFACLLGVSRSTVNAWCKSGKYQDHSDAGGNKFFYLDELAGVPEIEAMMTTAWESEKHTQPARRYTSVELFAGAGGLAVGMEKAGFSHVLLNEMDKDACKTLRYNRPQWKVVEGDIHSVDFTPLRGKVDLLSGGFPCQAFSYAGKRLGFEETRGTLFFELARAAREIQPLVLLGENVRGLYEHDGGRTLETIKNVIAEIGYTLIEPRILRAIQYDVPQKRERLFLVAVRNDIADEAVFEWPAVCKGVRTLREAFYRGPLYATDVPDSPGQVYPESKRRVMQLVPEGGDWRDLPDDVARNYMKGSYNLGGGKTGMARRLSMDEPSLTLTCAPAQKQTERCHPIETRPLTVREYARIQTFPDDWQFCGSMTAQYKQIGNAVPVNLAWAVGRSLVRMLNRLTVSGIASETIPYGCPASIMVKGTELFGDMACEPAAEYRGKDINE